MTTIVWFRQDLRISDNPALSEAAALGPVLPVFIHDTFETGSEFEALGGASRWWLHHSLKALAETLPGLVVLQGDPKILIPWLVKETGSTAVFWNRCYEPHSIERDTEVKALLKSEGVRAESFRAGLLNEPWELQTKAGGPFKVYSPFWKSLQAKPIALPLGGSEKVETVPFDKGTDLETLGLLPRHPNWADGWEGIWQPGEAGARDRLSGFLQNGLSGYGEDRNRPDLQKVSRLSPHLHFGEISPRQVWQQVLKHTSAQPQDRKDAMKFLSEIAWREFAYHLLFHFPTLPTHNWRPAFDAYPWRECNEDLKRWQRGQTGYPIVDAGMRELWQTGYMHNRVRMITASFLVKHLRLHWRLGEAWFWDTLVDADLANNAAGWQWVAGSGADAAPYFRVFNPITQAAKFDPDGNYIHRWVPELANLAPPHLFAPFEASKEILDQAGVKLGESYPMPIVAHSKARAAALAGYEAVRRMGQNAS